MVKRVRNCGNCHQENAEFTGVVLETDEEMDEDEDKGTERMRLELNVGSYLWSRFPCEFELYVRHPPIAVWYLYFTKLEDFVAQFRNRPMYMHGHVMLPVPATNEVRSLVYQNLYSIHPSACMI